MKISRHYAVAMINNDYEGLTEAEIHKLKKFPEFEVVDWSEGSRDINGVCAISGLYSHCVEIETR